MEITATLSRKGQLTIPKQVRVLLGLKPGDGIVCEVSRKSSREETAKKAFNLAGSLTSFVKNKEPLTEEAMHQAIIKGAAEGHSL